MKIKDSYIINAANQLVVRRKQKNLITNGRFNVDQKNRLIYYLNEPASWRRDYHLPGKIIFEGTWSLNSNYDLELNLAENKEQYRVNRLVLKGEIISVEKNVLVFEIKSVDEQSHSHIQLLKLSGFWQADEFNRLVFLVKKDALPGEPLTFNGIWQINQNQQIIYTYEKRDLKTKSKISHTLGFIGFWQITSADRLTYVLSRTLNSGFDFRAHLESPNLYPQQGVIKYRLGIGLRKNKLYKDKIICLYGAWKFSRKFSLIFEMDYSRGKVQQIEFGTDISLSQKDKVLLELKNKAGEPLGMHITFTRRFLNKLDAEVFLRLKAKQKERGIETGINIPF